MGFVRKFRLEIALGVAFVILYFVIRLYHILSLPIFTDEAIYLRWAQIAKQDPSWRFISLTDGKQPMFVWVTMIAMRFIHDPLLAGRLVSVGTGIFSMVGLFFVGWELFKNRWIGILSAFLYLIYPFALVYDRMALYDNMVGAFAIWGFYFVVLLVRRIRLDISLILAMVAGGGMLTKTNGFFTIYLLPFSLALFDFKKKERTQRFIRWAVLAVVATGISYLYYSILRLSPFFHIIDEKNTIFVYPFREWLSHPFEFFVSNWSGLFNWLLTYMTLPLLLLAVASFVISKSYLREKALLFIWFFVPFIALAFFGKTLYPRHIFFMTLFLLPLIAYSLQKLYEFLKDKRIFAFCFFVAIALPLFSQYRILTNFSVAPIPESDRNQYNNDWPSGGGVKEAVSFFSGEAQKGKIYIATEGTFGLMPYSLEMYLVENPNVKIKGYWPVTGEEPKEVMDMSKKVPTYFVFYQPCVECQTIGSAPATWKNLKLVLRVTKPLGSRYFSVYQVLP